MTDVRFQKHNFVATALFHVKACLLRLKRFFTNCRHPVAKLRVYSREIADYPVLLGQSSSPLWDLLEPQEFKLTLGKVQNLRIARQSLDGLFLPQGRTFSFWRQMGRLSRWRGYVTGRELREGCLVPSVGGGICQITNALYDAACQSGFTILERSRHTKVLPNSFATRNRDATVFWNYVDLRFVAPVDVRLSVDLTATTLNVSFWAKSKPKSPDNLDCKQILTAATVNACDSCGQMACAQALQPITQRVSQKTVFIVDEYWPEYASYLDKTQTQNDEIFFPLDGKRWRKNNYAWPTQNFSRVRQSLWRTWVWSFKMRRLSNQGPARQTALLSRDRALARAFAKQIPWDATRCVVMQNFLPELVKTGFLAGRPYDVLMTRLPMKILQAELNVAKTLWPESTTLSDFRVPEEFANHEWNALERASAIITPHTRIADIFPEKTILLKWDMPALPSHKKHNVRRGQKIIFPATTVARKGAYLVRKLAQDLGVSVVLVGTIVEDAAFWNGIPTEHRHWHEEWWQDGAVVVLPAIIEHKPRAVLQALQLGLPVVASPAVGLNSLPNLTLLPWEDWNAWKEKIQNFLSS